MLKKIATTIVAMILGLFIYANTVFAIPSDTGSEYLTLIDVDGNDDSIFTMNIVNPNIPPNIWNIGIYSFSTNSSGDTELVDTLNIIDYTSGVDYASVDFDLTAGTATNNNGDVANIGSDFGIYFGWLHESSSIKSIYTHSALNPKDTDRFMITDSDNMFDSTVICDYFAMGIHDAVPAAPVPEPATILLLGSGTLGLLIAKRKKLV